MIMVRSKMFQGQNVRRLPQRTKERESDDSGDDRGETGPKIVFFLCSAGDLLEQT